MIDSDQKDRLVSLRDTFIQKWTQEYTSYNTTSSSVEFGNITYYPVGHNSSHTFYVGVDTDGQMYRMTVGDEFNEELDDYQAGVKKASKIDSLAHYWGHY